MIRVGFLGCAHVHAQTYAAHLASADVDKSVLGGTPVAVFDHDATRAQGFAATNALTVAGSAEHLCDLVDAVIITSEHVRYPELVGAAATRDVPVLCEKPFGTSVVAARAMVGAGGWVSMALPIRYAHPVRQAKALIDQGELGRLLAISGVNHAAFPGSFFGHRSHSGGGAIIDHVVHLADTAHWLTGCEFRTVFAAARNVRCEGDVEDSAQVVASTTEGAWVSIDPSWSRPAGMTGDVDFLMTLWFERGQIDIDAFARRATVTSKGGTVSYPPYGTEMDRGLLGDWLGAIAAGAPPPIPVNEGWLATRLALGALHSADTGHVVDLQSQEWIL